MINKKSILFVLIAAIMLFTSTTIFSSCDTPEENNEDSYEAGSGKEAADSTGLDLGLGLEEISDVSEYDAESYVLTPDNQNEEKIKVSLKSEMVPQDDTFCVELSFGEDVADYYFVTDTISVIKDDYKVNGNKADINMISDDNDIKSLDLELLAKDEFSMLEIYIDLGDGEYQRKIIFAYTTDGMTFVSDLAEDDAWNKALHYLFDSGLITAGEMENRYSVLSHMRITDETITVEYPDN